MSESKDELGALEATIVDHAAMLSDKEWNNEQRPILFELLANCGLAARLNERTGDLVEPGTLAVDGRDIPIETIAKALREQFIQHRKKSLIQGMIQKLVADAGRKVLDEEEAHE